MRNVGDGTDYIAIKDMTLKPLEEENNIFSIPLTVSFIAPSKRAFLLLIDKLSLTFSSDVKHPLKGPLK